MSLCTYEIRKGGELDKAECWWDMRIQEPSKHFCWVRDWYSHCGEESGTIQSNSLHASL